MRLDPAAIESIEALVLGFAFAGFIASAFELFTARRASFHLLQAGGAVAVASVPMLVFSAPFIILRNTVRGRRFEHRPVSFVMLATMIACGWSLMSGRLVLDVAQRLAGA
ncbi:MAG TPA: hypothetical protein VIL65_17260 [Beijerinckiaceae bacterium]|jgi:hypothetical protein